MHTCVQLPVKIYAMVKILQKVLPMQWSSSGVVQLKGEKKYKHLTWQQLPDGEASKRILQAIAGDNGDSIGGLCKHVLLWNTMTLTEADCLSRAATCRAEFHVFSNLRIIWPIVEKWEKRSVSHDHSNIYVLLLLTVNVLALRWTKGSVILNI